MQQATSNLHPNEDMDEKIKVLDLRVPKLIGTHQKVIGELPPPASCDKLVEMDFKLKQWVSRAQDAKAPLCKSSRAG